MSDAGRVREGTDPERSDYAGAIYGSLLAASVVAGTGPGQDPPRPIQLMVLLLATGIVFWLAHVYAQIFGERTAGRSFSRKELRRAAAREWPIVQAAVPPAVAAGVGGLIGLSDSGAAWLALFVAVAAQVGWAVYVAVKAGATRGSLAVSVAVYVVLGLLIILLKSALSH